jgi:hypothetical protein
MSPQTIIRLELAIRDFMIVSLTESLRRWKSEITKIPKETISLNFERKLCLNFLVLSLKYYSQCD